LSLRGPLYTFYLSSPSYRVWSQRIDQQAAQYSTIDFGSALRLILRPQIDEHFATLVYDLDGLALGATGGKKPVVQTRPTQGELP
jgi:hypothetical protein